MPVPHRSPNYGHRTRPPHRRRIFVVGYEPAAAGVRVAVQGERVPLVWLEARDHTDAVVKVELLRQGAFSLPINQRAAALVDAC